MLSRNKRIAALLSGLATLALLLSCAPTEKPTVAPGALTPTEAKPKTGGMLNVFWPSDPSGLDPHLNSSRNYESILVFSGLVRFTPDLKAEPELAESWEVSKDGRTWTFKLRKGVKFHDIPPVNGREMTAEDVVYSFKRQATSEPKFMWRHITQEFDQMETPDKYTVKITTKEPMPMMLGNVGHMASTIVPKEAVEKFGDLNKTAIGTGAFWIGNNYEPGNVWRLRKHKDYFLKGKPYLDGVDQWTMADQAAQIAAFRAGQVDVFTASNSWKAVETIQKTNPQAQLWERWHTTTGLQMNTKNPPLNDVRVRRAIHLALDRQQINDLMLFGKGKLMGFIPFLYADYARSEPELARMPGFRQPKDADIAEAKKLLAAAGFPDGKGLKPLYMMSFWFQYSWQPVIREQLAKIGINAEVHETGAAEMLRRRVDGTFDLVLEAAGGWLLTDPDFTLLEIYHSKGGKNWPRYVNTKVDELITKQRTTLNKEERIKLIRQAEDILFEEMPAATIVVQPDFTLAHPHVKNYDKVGKMPGWLWMRWFDEVWVDK